MPDPTRWTNSKRPCGFRFSLHDLFTTLAVTGLTWALVFWLGTLGWLPLIVLGHFFLFCNVFRIGMRPELIWTAVFVVNVSAWWLAGATDWVPVLLTQTPVTVFLCVRAIRDPRYHGVLSRPRQRSDRVGDG